MSRIVIIIARCWGYPLNRFHSRFEILFQNALYSTPPHPSCNSKELNYDIRVQRLNGNVWKWGKWNERSMLSERCVGPRFSSRFVTSCWPKSILRCFEHARSIILGLTIYTFSAPRSNYHMTVIWAQNGEFTDTQRLIADWSLARGHVPNTHDKHSPTQWLS